MIYVTELRVNVVGVGSVHCGQHSAAHLISSKLLV